MAYGTVNADVIGTSVAGSNLGAGNASIMKNRIINGAMVIDQRNAGASVTPATGNVYLVDRWAVYSTTGAKFTAQQNAGSVTPPAGFTNYLGITSTSAYTLVTDNYFLFQRIEANNILGTNWGTSNATPLTLSFWVYSSLTGTFAGGCQNSNQSRSFPFTYTVSSANTWQQITIAIPADTTGGPYTGTGSGFQVNLGFGNNTGTGSATGAWQAANYYTASGGVSVVGTNNATFYITGVQLEVGTSATGFEYRQYQQELALCQRYAVLLGTLAGGYTFTYGMGFAPGGTQMWRWSPYLTVPMRATPSMTAVNMQTWSPGNGAQTLTSFSTIYFLAGFAQADVNAGGNIATAGYPATLQTNGTGGASYLLISAEL